jgi:hypothetical protein
VIEFASHLILIFVVQRGNTVTRAYCSPSVLQHNGETTGYLMGILVHKSCPNHVYFLVVDTEFSAAELKKSNTSMNEYGQCILHIKVVYFIMLTYSSGICIVHVLLIICVSYLQVPKKASKIANDFLKKRVYRQEGFITERGVYANHYLQYRGGRKPAAETDRHQPGDIYIIIYSFCFH